MVNISEVESFVGEETRTKHADTMSSRPAAVACTIDQGGTDRAAYAMNLYQIRLGHH